MLFAEIKAKWFVMPRVPLSRRLWVGRGGEGGSWGGVVREVRAEDEIIIFHRVYDEACNLRRKR